MALDYGEVRIGIAFSDLLLTIASPYETYKRKGEEIDLEFFKNLAKEKAEALGIKLGDFMMPIRMAVTGSRVSPPLIGSILVLGKEKSIARIDKTLAALN